MGRTVPVRADGIEFFAEVTDGGGPQVVGLGEVLSFEGVRETITAIGKELSKTWETVKPAEATAELGLNLTVKSGRLTGLLVEGGGEASLKITLTWKHG